MLVVEAPKAAAFEMLRAETQAPDYIFFNIFARFSSLLIENLMVMGTFIE